MGDEVAAIGSIDIDIGIGDIHKGIVAYHIGECALGRYAVAYTGIEIVARQAVCGIAYSECGAGGDTPRGIDHRAIVYWWRRCASAAV